MKTTAVPLVLLSALLGLGVLPASSLADLVCPGRPDCNANNEDDRCDVSCSNSGVYCVAGQPVSAACNSGYFPSCGTFADCNEENGVPDECEACVSAEWAWVDPCVGGTTCGPSGVCVCEAGWNDQYVWTGLQCTVDCLPAHTYPQLSGDEPTIEKAFAGTCDRGDHMGEPCGADVDCAPCEDVCPRCVATESSLRIRLTTETISHLTIKTKDTEPSSDHFELWLMNKDAGGNTLTVASLRLDATNGKLTATVTGATTVTTN